MAIAEVCGTAIETPMTVTVRLTVLKDKKHIKTPHYSTPFATDDPKGYYATTGVGPGKNISLTLS